MTPYATHYMKLSGNEMVWLHKMVLHNLREEYVEWSNANYYDYLVAANMLVCGDLTRMPENSLCPSRNDISTMLPSMHPSSLLIRVRAQKSYSLLFLEVPLMSAHQLPCSVINWELRPE